jgi:hypothetical protein
MSYDCDSGCDSGNEIYDFQDDGCGYQSGSCGGYNGVCDADTPYPITSQESVPSLIDNLITALYGEIQKDVSNGKIVWIIPCDPNNSAQVPSLPRNAGEGLLCYILRTFQYFAGGGIVDFDSIQTLSNKTFNNSLVTGTIGFGSAIVSGGNFSSITSGKATSLANGAAGSLPYQTGSGVTTFLPVGTAGQVLSPNGSGGLQWITNTSVNTSATNLLNGAASQIPYQISSGSTGFIANGTSGQFLGSNGTSVPTFKTITAANVGAATPQQAIAFAIALS